MFHNFKFVYFAAILLSGLSFYSCNKVKSKKDKIVNETKRKVGEYAEKAADNIKPVFDWDKPDTKFNKKRFEEFFGFSPTEDVKKIYCYADRMGIDSKFMFSFKCNIFTKERIVKNLALIQSPQPDNFSEGLWENFSWWDSAAIVTINPYWRKWEHEYYNYLWFDAKKQVVYFIDFDM